MDDLKIVDAHHHLWDLAALRYPWLHDDPPHAFFLGDYAPLKRNYLPADYRRDAANHNVVATVHVEAECDRNDQVGETRWLTAVNAEHGMPNAIVGHAWFDRPNTEDVLAAHTEFPLMRGIRSKPVTGATPQDMRPGAPGTMQDDNWLSGFALLEKYDLSWDLRVPTWHLLEAADVARAFPNTRIVLNHTGFPWDRSHAGLDMWREGMQALAACANVHCKLSCLCLPDGPWELEGPTGNRAILLETIAIFGVDRCMFASNFPVDGLRIGYDAMFTAFKDVVADMPRSDQEKLFAGNAARFYRIEIQRADNR